MKAEITKGKGLPRFDTTGWLSTSIVASMALFASGLWSALARWEDPFFPFQFGKIWSMVIGISLAIHCVDMIVYHGKRRGFK